MFWPLTLLHRPKPSPTLEDTRREQLRSAQFELLDARANAERWNFAVDMLATRCNRLQASIE